MQFKIIRLLSISLLTALSSSCGGGDNLAKDVEFIVPEEPIVINAKRLAYDPTTNEYTEVPAPNYDFTYTFVNNSEKRLIVSAIKLKATNFKNGSTVTGTTDISSTTFCELPPSSTRSYLADVDPNGGTWDGDSACNGSGSPDQVIAGLPEASNFNYTIEVTAFGYFTEVGSVTPIERYEYTQYMYTR